MDIGVVVMGVRGVDMHVFGMGTGGMDATVYEVGAAAPEINCGALLQIRLRQQRSSA